MSLMTLLMAVECRGAVGQAERKSISMFAVEEQRHGWLLSTFPLQSFKRMKNSLLQTEGCMLILQRAKHLNESHMKFCGKWKSIKDLSPPNENQAASLREALNINFCSAMATSTQGRYGGCRVLFICFGFF